jgi:hypothetical protein
MIFVHELSHFSFQPDLQEALQADENYYCPAAPLEALLLEGLESEESELTRQDFEDIRRKAVAQLKRRKKKN